MNFFFDNNLPPDLARALNFLSKKQGHKVVPLRDKFKTNIVDVNWINTLKNEGNWVVISGDLRILRNPHERAAWLESGLTVFFLAKGWANVSYWVKAWKLVKWWPEVISQAKMIKSGTSFIIPISGQQMTVVN